MNKTKQRLSNHKGRFLTLNVTRAKTGVQSYSAKVLKLTDNTVVFWDANAKKSVKAPLKNVSVS